MDEPLGIVKVPLSFLDFPEGRAIDEKIVTKILEVFGESPYGCDPSHDLNIIPARINHNDLQRLLHESELSLEDLRASLVEITYRPSISGVRLQCQYGRHRVEAAKRLPADKHWWTIKLLLCNTYEGARHTHESKYSAGEIYYRIRQFEDMGQYDSAGECRLLLSRSMRRDMTWLLKRLEYTYWLDKLCGFPGLRDGLELGNVRRLFALRCDEEVQRYLRHISVTWEIITLHREELKELTDIGTVRLLQGRCPFASEVDKRFITSAMASKKLFPQISNDNYRQQITQQLLHLRVIIPSMKTLHENCKLLEIAVKIVRDILDPRRDISLIDALRDMWRQPAECLIEVEEGIFMRSSLQRRDDHFNVAFLQLMLAALRRFGSLSGTPPRRDVRQVKLLAHVKQEYKELFLMRAELLGWPRGGHNTRSAPVCLPPIRRRPYPSSIRAMTDIKSRYGRPFDFAYQQLKDQLFYPNIIEQFSTSQQPSPLFVLHDFLEAFFVINQIAIDNTTEATSLVTRQSRRLSVSDSSHTPARSQPTSPANQISESLILQQQRQQPIQFDDPNTTDQDPSESQRRTSTMSMSLYNLENDTPPIEVDTSEVENQGNEIVLHRNQAQLISPTTFASSAQTSPKLVISPEISGRSSYGIRSPMMFGALFPSPSRAGQQLEYYGSSTRRHTSLDDRSPSPHSFAEGLQGRRTYAGGFFGTRRPTEADRETANQAQEIPIIADHSRNHRSYALDNLQTGQSTKEQDNQSSSANESIVALTSEMSGVDYGRATELGDRQDTRSYAQPAMGLVVFTEYNGMKTFERTTRHLEAYLSNRRRWVGMILDKGSLKTIRLDQITSYIEKIGLRDGRSLILVKQNHAERFRKSHETKRKSGLEIVGVENGGKRIRI